MHKISHYSWVDHLMNFFIVLLSLSLAFWVDNYREDLQEHEIENRNLQSILLDLNEDIPRLKELISIDKTTIDSIQRVLNFSPQEKSERISKEDKRFDHYATIIGIVNFWRAPFSYNDFTFESMHSSGKLDIISDMELRKSIVEVYRKTAPANTASSYNYYYREMNSFQEALSRSIRHAYDNEDSDSKDPGVLYNRKLDILISSDFIGNLLHYQRSLEFQTAAYKYALNKCKDLAKRLQQKLEE